MGAWGPSLYANDTTSDVRDSYTSLLQNQESNFEAYQKTVKKYNELMGDEDEEPLFWYALADTQWRYGRLMPNVKIKAIEWIEMYGGISLWEESKNGGKGWIKTLEKLRNKLESTMPAEKDFSKQVSIVTNPWNTGDVYAYLFHTEKAEEFGLMGKFIMIKKIGETTVHYGDTQETFIYSVIQTYDKIFDEVPSLSDIDGVRLLPFVGPDIIKDPPKYDYNKLEYNLSASLLISKKLDYREKYFTFIGNQTYEERIYKFNDIMRIWMYNKSFEDHLGSCFLEWQNAKY